MNSASELISTYDAALLVGQSQRTIVRLVRRGLLAAAPNPQSGRKLWVVRAQVLALREMIKAEGERRQKQALEHSDLKQMYLELISLTDNL